MKKRIISILVLVCMMCPLLAGCRDGATVANESRNGVARVLEWYNSYEVRFVDGYGNLRDDFGSYTSKGYWSYNSGTAFGVGKAGKETNTFVTNRHVVEGGYDSAELSWNYVLSELVTQDPSMFQRLSELSAMYPDVYPLATGEPTGVFILLDDYAFRDGKLDMDHAVECKILYRGNEYEPDLAVLQTMDGEPVPGRVALPLLAPGEKIASGKSVYALGYPGTTDDRNPTLAASVERVTVTNGIVSLHSQFEDDNGTLTDIIQHTALTNHGNSGCPILDERGAVVGVHTWGWGQSDTTGNSAVKGCIEIYYLRDRLDDLNISYDVYPAGVNTLLVIGIAVAALVVIAVVVVVVMKRKPHQPPIVNPPVSQPPVQPQPQPQPQPQAKPVIAGDTGLRIQGVTGQFAGRRFAIAGTLRIGRDPARNDLVYPADSQGVSGVHCVMIVEGGRLLVKDLGSTYGTFVGGNRLAANAPVELQVGDRFCLGSERETFVVARKGTV